MEWAFILTNYTRGLKQGLSPDENVLKQCTFNDEVNNLVHGWKYLTSHAGVTL